MRSITILTAAGVLASLWMPSVTKATPETGRAIWDRFLGSEGAGWAVSWGDRGIPEAIQPRPAASLPGWSRDHSSAVRAFFAKHAELFGIRQGKDELRLVSETQERGVWHMRMRQFYRGLPVISGEYMVSVGQDGSLRLIAGRFYPGLETAIQARLSPGAALSRAAAGIDRDPSQYAVTSELVIDPGTDHAQLAHEVRLKGLHISEDWAVHVSDDNGAVLSQNDRTSHATGCGNVYQFDPLVNPTLVPVTFPISNPTGEMAALEGPRVSVVDEQPPQFQTDAYNLTSNCWDFGGVTGSFEDQVNLYYQMERFLGQFLPSLGFGGLGHPVTATIKRESADPYWCQGCVIGGDTPDEYNVHMNGCSLCRDASLVADYIYHEAQHTVSHHYGLAYASYEYLNIYAASIHEAFSNYFACAVNNDGFFAEFPGFGGQFNPDNPSPTWNYSRVHILFHLGNPVYQVGMIWSGALWDLRRVIVPGPATADSIALESYSYMPSLPTFQCAAAAVIQADIDHHHGNQEAAIRTAFVGRGFDSAPCATVSGPAVVYRFHTGVFTAAATCGIPPYTFHWTLNTCYDEDHPYQMDLGTGPQVTVSGAACSFMTLHVLATDSRGKTGEASVPITVQDFPPNPPYALNIDGAEPVTPGALWDYTAALTGGPMRPPLPTTIHDHWERSCRDPGCVPVVIADGPSTTTKVIHFASDRNFDLSVHVTGPGIDLTTMRTFHINGMPDVSIQGPPDLAVDDMQRYEAHVVGGQGPFTYVWMRDGLNPENVIGTGDYFVWVTGEGSPIDLYLAVTTSTGLHADIAHFHIGTGTGPQNLVAVRMQARNPLGGDAVQLALDVRNAGTVRVRAFDLTGREVSRVADGPMSKGRHDLTWDTHGLPQGVYFVVVNSGRYESRQRVAVIR